MRLLKKPQIAEDNALIRKRQIDEGVQVAKKVDEMRRLLSELERNKSIFISNQVKELDNATSHLYKRKESLESIILTLEKKREELKKPLDQEWNKLNKEKLLLINKERELDIRSIDIDDRDYSLLEREKTIQDKENKASILVSETEENAKQSREDRDNSKQILTDAYNKRDKINQDIEKKLSEFESVKQKIEFDLKANEQFKRNNELKEQELKERLIKLVDREQILQRNIKRNGRNS